MKLNVFVSIVGTSVSQWYHYSMEVHPIRIPNYCAENTPPTVEGTKEYRSVSGVTAARINHPAIKRLRSYEHLVTHEVLLRHFDSALRKHDPSQDCMNVLVMHSARTLYRHMTLDRIHAVLKAYPFVGKDDVTIIYVGDDGLEMEMTLEEYTHRLHQDAAAEQSTE